MLRWAFAIYMVLVTLAGQGLCCCSLTHLVATATHQHPISDDLPPCCQSPCHTEGSLCADSCPGDHSDNRQPGCPCRKVETPPALLTQFRSETEGPQFPTTFVEPSLLPAFACLPMTRGTSALPGVSRAFLTTADLLCVHHQLRC